MMTNRRNLIALAFASALALSNPASAQGVGGNASLSVSTATARVAFPFAPPTQFPSVILAPSPGTTQEIFYKLGNSTVVATTLSPALPAGGICVNIGPATNIAAIVGTGSGTLRITQVSGCTTFSGASSAAGGGGPVSQSTAPWIVGPTKGATAYSPVTIGVSSAQALAALTATVFLDIVNESATATIACNAGSPATINGAGSITIPPLWHRSWEGSFVPTDAINCIASAAATPATIGVK